MTTDLVLSEPAQALDLLADPKFYMEHVLGRAIMWLGDVEKVEEVVATKAMASAYEVFIREKELGHDAQLAAAEIIRRCERRIGQLVRGGQDDGRIRSRGERITIRNQYGISAVVPDKESSKQSPRDFFSGGSEMEDTYTMTDEVPDDVFENAIDAGKAEGNLSRANVIRKIKGDDRVFPKLKEKQRADAIRDLAATNLTSSQIAKTLGRSAQYIREEARRMGIDVPADKVVGKTRQIDPNRVVGETITTLEGVAYSIDLLGGDYSGLDAEQVPHWVASLSTSARSVKRLLDALKEINP